MDIHKSKKLKLQTTIADFWHCNNILDRAVATVRFQIVITLVQIIGSDFKIPNRRQVDEELLDLNNSSCSDQNLVIVGKDSEVFRITWMSGRPTMPCMPLVNILVACGDVPPTVIDIHNYTDHMVDDGKNDTLYLAGVMQEEIKHFDKEKKFTDMFYFDGASNVQKAGLRLTALYPRAYVFHGGDHVIHVFFRCGQVTPY